MVLVTINLSTTECIQRVAYVPFIESDKLYISLTEHSLTFCKSGITFLEDLLKMSQPSVQYLVDSGIQKMWSCLVLHIENSLTSVVNIKEVSTCQNSKSLYVIDMFRKS